ncbi:hypothetical protein ACFTUC_40170 [Streptomyces sp. NPDC056944]|uniref:hypothetical protein n=1 Tax=Streptomyces sp. NPDC056944 TaxID=3345972 RepID=UPI00362BA222
MSPSTAAGGSLTGLTALAYADGPLTADALAAALSWTRHRLDAALDHARAHPDAGGALVLRHVAPEAYTATPRLDILRPDQADAITGREKPHASVRGPIQPAEAEVLLRVWGDGGIDPHDAAQSQALEDLATAEMVTRGDIIGRFHDKRLGRTAAFPLDGDDALAMHPRYAEWSRDNDLTAAFVAGEDLKGRWWTRSARLLRAQRPGHRRQRTARRAGLGARPVR